MEQHILRRIHRQHIQCNDQQYILRFDVFRREEQRCNVHKQLFRRRIQRHQCQLLSIHPLHHRHIRMVLAHILAHDMLGLRGRLA